MKFDTIYMPTSEYIKKLLFSIQETATTIILSKEASKQRSAIKKDSIMIPLLKKNDFVIQQVNETYHHKQQQQQIPAAVAQSTPKSLRNLTAMVLSICLALLVCFMCNVAQLQAQLINANKLLTNRRLGSSSSQASSLTLPLAAAGTSPSLTTGLHQQATNNGKMLVCYFTNWAQYRPKEGKYVPEDIDPHLCTHIIVAFGWLKKNKLAPFDSSDESTSENGGKKGTYERVTALKAINPNLKVLLAIGGWSFGTERFKTLAANKYNRQVFIFSALEYLRARNFDGLDIDWEYPGAADKKNFVDLLKELRDAFEFEAKEKKLPRLLLSVAVGAGSDTVKTGYDVPLVSSAVDFINVMAYDFHGKWEPKTGHNAPLFSLSSETEWRKMLSIEYSIKLWEKLGAQKSKLVVGLATYGRSFTLASQTNRGMNAAASGGGKAGEFTREAGFLAFYEICDMLKQGASYYWDEEQAVPYAVAGDQWVGFDDELSIRNKVKWINEQGYAGAMVWALDMDDFRGNCARKKYPLLRAMAEGLFNLPQIASPDWVAIVKAAQNQAKIASGSSLNPTTLTNLGNQINQSGSIVASGSGANSATGSSAAAVSAQAAAQAATNMIIAATGASSQTLHAAIKAAVDASGGAQANAADLVSNLKLIPNLNLNSGVFSSPEALAVAAVAAATAVSNQHIQQQGSQLHATGADLNNLLQANQTAAISAAALANGTNARVVCYYTSWSYKRPGIAKFGPEHLDPHLCTHIIYAFYGLKDSKLTPTEDIDISDNGDKAPFKRIIALKELNPNLKVLLAVGGWMMGQAPFRQLTENAYRQSMFTFEVIEFLRKKHFDGLDLCWEFPRGQEDKEKFVGLVKELRESFEGEAKASGSPRLTLTAAVPASFEAINAGYDVPAINKYLDFMNVMTYDFHGDWEKLVGHNSPLYPLNSALPHQKKLTVDYSVSEWIKMGASKENLVVGLPTYGRTYTLDNENLTDIDAPASKGGKPGQYTKESGFLSFFEICEMLKNSATLVWDNEQMIPYAYKADQWVGFDDPRSFKMKVQWLKQNGLSGIMIWSIDMDDFTGSCMGLRYPLIKSAKEELKGYYVPNLIESPSSANGKSLSAKDKDELVCEEADGLITYHKDKKDCHMYYMCEGNRKHHMPCPQNLVFNQNEHVCDWPENVEGHTCPKVAAA